jgi:hypothetical protein
MDMNRIYIETQEPELGKYEIKQGAKENLSNDFPIFRLTDFKLMKAECAYRNGGDYAAHIDPIRQRAGLSGAAGFWVDSIFIERARELYVEGHRRQDQIREGSFTDPWWEKGGDYEVHIRRPISYNFPNSIMGN